MKLNKTDKLCLWLILAVLLAAGGAVSLLDSFGGGKAADVATVAMDEESAALAYAAYAAAELPDTYDAPEGEDPDEADKIEEALLEQGYYREDVPLDYSLQDVLRTECEANGIPYEVGLGLIETESNFQADAVNPASGCYGLCQLNPAYFATGLEDWENIKVGMAYLGGQLVRYDGDIWAALAAYHAGHDTGDREYAEKVMAAAERWLVGE